MKRIGHLFGRVVEPDNLRLREGLLEGDYPLGNYRRFTIREPKEREICAAAFGERVLHHAPMNVCEPYFDSWLIPDPYACRKGKGQLKAVERASVRAGRNVWFLRGDFRKYFDSVPHEGLMDVLARTETRLPRGA